MHEKKGSKADQLAYTKKCRTAEFAFGPEVAKLHSGDALCVNVPNSAVKGAALFPIAATGPLFLPNINLKS